MEFLLAGEQCEYRVGQNAPKDGAPDTADVENAGDQESCKEDENARVRDIRVELEQCTRRLHHHPCVSEPDERDKETDSNGNPVLQAWTDPIDNGRPYAHRGQDEKENAGNERDPQGNLPGLRKTCCGQAHDDRDKKEVFSHARCLRNGIIGKDSHENTPDECGNTGSEQDCIVGKARGISCKISRQHSGIDKQDVGHGHERGDPCQNFNPRGGLIFLQSKDSLQHDLPQRSHLFFR